MASAYGAYTLILNDDSERPLVSYGHGGRVILAPFNIIPVVVPE